VTLPGNVCQPVERLVTEEARAMRAFVCLLEDEREALRSGTDEQLLRIASSKNRCCDSLQELGADRTAAIAAQACGTGREELSVWLAQFPPGSALRSIWSELIALTSRAQALNEENGVLIRARALHNRRALAILMDRVEPAGVYGPDGQARIGGIRRDLGTV
jgi:flagellar biosynthesis/type III secretory pathway chaperone